jgi:ABC-type protease/lipase transport system fused ATPase/permease subunit
MSSYQKKEEALQVLTRNNYLVSDQKVTQDSSSSSSKQNKIKSSADISHRLNILNNIDKIMINKSAVQDHNKSENVFNPYNLVQPPQPPQQPQQQFQNTEQILKHMQSFIQ